jgi:preprotein translocase subunit SecA
MMPGRRYSEGLHQAIEAKERVKIQPENQTLASITFQNYFRLYDKLSGMTGTADRPRPAEFHDIYKLDVIWKSRPTVRCSASTTTTEVYRTEPRRTDAIVGLTSSSARKRASRCWSAPSRSRSPRSFAEMLKRRGIKHVVLNAKLSTSRKPRSSRRPATPGAVTIATNMAGRGTDILLGGNERIFTALKAETDTDHKDVVNAGGLHIIGTERHEARRIDNQLRGRAGRQGDPGSSRFYLSLEDDLMRIFMGSERISGLMQRLGMEDGVPIEARMVTKAIERAQKQVEAQNFGTRKHLLEYDDVMNKQRESVYTLRRQLLEGKVQVDEEEVLDTRGYLMMLAEDFVDNLVETHAPKDGDPESWDLDALRLAAADAFGLDSADLVALELGEMTPSEIVDALLDMAVKQYEAKEQTLIVEPTLLRRVERDIMLQIVDAQWKDHLYGLDHLKEGIGLRGYGQRDPLVEYKKESFSLFQAMKERIDDEIVRYLWRLRPVVSEGGDPVPPPPVVRKPAPPMTFSSGSSTTAGATALPRGVSQSAPPMPSRTGGDDAEHKPVRRDEPKVGRNDPCPCGSGKKYKKCHGQ